MASDLRLYLCCHKLSDLEIPVSFGFARFVMSLEAGRSRVLRVVAMENGASFTLASIVTPRADVIVHRPSRAPIRDIQVVVHQAAHILLGHHGIPLSDAVLGHLLFPGLDDLLIRYSPSAEMSCGVGTAGEEGQATALARDLLRRGETAFPEQSAA